MIYKKVLDNRFLVRNATLSDAIGMEYVQKMCFPTLHPSELMGYQHFESHIKTFPQGQLIVEFEGQIIGSASTLRCDFPKQDHSFMEASDDLWIIKTNKPKGDWMYGIDMGVLPKYRRLGLSKELYKARSEVCVELGIIGQIISGMTIGYSQYKTKMTIQEYCLALEKKQIIDPTIEPQLRAGFRWIRPIYNYINDEECGHASILMYLPINKNYYI